MFTQPIIRLIKSLAEKYQKPRTYGSALEAYITARNPKDAADVERFNREFDQRMANRREGGFP